MKMLKLDKQSLILFGLVFLPVTINCGGGLPVNIAGNTIKDKEKELTSAYKCNAHLENNKIISVFCDIPSQSGAMWRFTKVETQESLANAPHGNQLYTNYLGTIEGPVAEIGLAAGKRLDICDGACAKK